MKWRRAINGTVKFQRGAAGLSGEALQNELSLLLYCICSVSRGNKLREWTVMTSTLVTDWTWGVCVCVCVCVACACGVCVCVCACVCVYGCDYEQNLYSMHFTVCFKEIRHPQKKIHWRMLVSKHFWYPLTSMVWKKYYGSQWLPVTNILHNIFLCVQQKKENSQVWINMRVNFHFWGELSL